MRKTLKIPSQQAEGAVLAGPSSLPAQAPPTPSASGEARLPPVPKREGNISDLLGRIDLEFSKTKTAVSNFRFVENLDSLDIPVQLQLVGLYHLLNL